MEDSEEPPTVNSENVWLYLLQLCTQRPLMTTSLYVVSEFSRNR